MAEGSYWSNEFSCPTIAAFLHESVCENTEDVGLENSYSTRLTPKLVHDGRRTMDNKQSIGLILTLLILYEVMLLVQVQIETGVKGVFLSLLPSFSLSALGWYLKKRFQRKKRSQRRSETDLEEELLMPEEHSSITIEETENSDSDLTRL